MIRVNSLNIIIMENAEKSILEMILPSGIFKWFEAKEGKIDENNVYIVLEEKNIPPLSGKEGDKRIIAMGFKEITVTDFPIRGRRTLLTFKRRYWRIEGRKELLKRDIQLQFPGTQLEKEFAIFLKEDGGRASGLANFYRQVSKDPGERI